ncbi:PREDICTED: probable xyloglucan endotransglucosylase/hydrolase protein 10 [Ipomoea nil]|uniref:probable xyloglucan endotransglucosylase/hydrolase protein 10 n=1 Tax=Ipomoea nil TaxID=35883 RepID=UPI0009017016|nr:PREDICTED: probable xyloglucan endotransglucosylase/hydrolase protein 10 [Ipomoea nil]
MGRNICRLIVAAIIIIFLSILKFHVSIASVVSTGDFNRDFFVAWGPTHVITSPDGRSRSLKLDRASGSVMATKDMYLFGQFDMRIKLIPGNSAGTVVAFYLTSDQPNRDELDFEFLGNEPGKPCILQTNVFADGYGNREHRIRLWFDPTKDFHTYSILWNLHQIVFMVDWVPIRTYRNHVDRGVAYPRWQPMGLKLSVWDGDSWATEGGRVKIDWLKAPFIATFRDYRIDACVWGGNPIFCWSGGLANWWNNERSSTLTWAQRRLFRWVKRYHVIYDYCMDFRRFKNSLPRECFLLEY